MCKNRLLALLGAITLMFSFLCGCSTGKKNLSGEEIFEKLSVSTVEITAESDDGQIMALRHRQYDIRGIQFHPESVLTPDGHAMLANWLELGK